MKDGVAWYRSVAASDGESRDSGAPQQHGGQPEELRLAGTAMGQLAMVRRLVGAGVVSLEEALTMGSATPARALGLDPELGNIAPGARADLIVLEADTLELEQALVGGYPAR